MSRSERRHHAERIKRNRTNHWGRDLSDDPRQHGMAATTPKLCGCWMCSNQRKTFGPGPNEAKKIKAADLDMKESLE